MRKKIGLILFLSVLIPSGVMAQFANGSGTSGDPYEVATAAHLDSVRYFLTSHFIQTADIDLGGDDPGGDFYHSGLGWVPIGQSGSEFTGSYNGNGYKISGLYLERIGAGVRTGLFGYIDTDAVLTNMNLVDVDVTGNSPAGGLVGTNHNGTVSNSRVTGIVAGVSNVGGLVGLNETGNGLVTKSYANVAVSGTNSGVLVGNNSSGTVSLSFAEGTSGNASGGLVGRNNFGTIINSYATTDGATGGLAGYNSGTIEKSYSTGTADTGGLIASDGGGTVTDSYWNTETSGKATSAGGTGLTDSEMKQQASFNNWDFSTVWAIDDSYPYLISNPPVIALDPPVLMYPADNATGLEDSVTVVWHSVENADTYTFEASEASDFNDPGNLYEEGLTDTTYFIQELPPSTQLYWRVKAVSGGEESDWSTVFSFTSSANSLMPDPIVLISPADLATDQSLEATFLWHSDVFADEYQIQVDESDAFGSPVADQTSSDTTFTSSTLAAGTTYHWKVRGVNEYGNGEWSEAFNFTTEALLSSPVLLYPEDEATGIEDTVTIRWSSVENAQSYTLETSEVEDFNSGSNFLAEGIADTTFFGSGLPPSQVFYWRVKALAGEEESEWSNVFSFTTSANSAKPESIALISPADMAEELSTEVNFSWHAGVYAEEYRFQLSTENTFTSPVISQTTEDTSFFTDGLSEGSTYYWRVQGINVYHEGDWSEAFSFTVAEDPLESPQLLYPENEASGLIDTVTLAWHSVVGVDSYTLEVSEAGDFEDPENMLAEEVTDTTFFINELPPARQFYWRVKAIAENKESVWSEVFTFSTSPNSLMPDPIELISPADMAGDLSLEVAFNWHSDVFADDYQFQLDDQDLFASPVIDSTGTDTSLTSKTLMQGTTYYWRVRGVNEYGEAEWSEVFSFETEGSPPLVPILISPEDGATGLEDSVVFVWHSLPGIVNYEFEGSYKNDFSEGVFGTHVLVDTTLTVHVFPPDSTYYWRVRGIFTESPGEWSQVWSFTTGPRSLFPEVPVLHLPDNEASDVELTLDLSWFPDALLERYSIDVSYEIELSTEESFDPAEFSFTEHPDTAVTVEGLQENTQYYWRVLGTNEYGTGEWSEIRSFTTKILTSLDLYGDIPKEFALLQNYPNPFNPSTVISYQVPVNSVVRLEIFNMLGQKVATLVNGESKSPGTYKVAFDGKELTSGMYFYRLKANDKVFIKKQTLIK